MKESRIYVLETKWVTKMTSKLPIRCAVLDCVYQLARTMVLGKRRPAAFLLVRRLHSLREWKLFVRLFFLFYYLLFYVVFYVFLLLLLLLAHIERETANGRECVCARARVAAVYISRRWTERRSIGQR